MNEKAGWPSLLTPHNYDVSRHHEGKFHLVHGISRDFLLQGWHDLPQHLGRKILWKPSQRFSQKWNPTRSIWDVWERCVGVEKKEGGPRKTKMTGWEKSPFSIGRYIFINGFFWYCQISFSGVLMFFQTMEIERHPQEICGLLRDSIHHGGFGIPRYFWGLDDTLLVKQRFAPENWWLESWKTIRLAVGWTSLFSGAFFGCWFLGTGEMFLTPKMKLNLRGFVLGPPILRFLKIQAGKLAPKKEARWLWFGLQVSILRLAHWVLLFVVTKRTSGSRLGCIHNED